MYQSKLVNLIHVRNLDRCSMCTSQVLWGASVLHRARQIYNYRFRDISEFISLALPVSVCVGSTARQSANLSVIILPNPVQRVRAPQGEGEMGIWDSSHWVKQSSASFSWAVGAMHDVPNSLGSGRLGSASLCFTRPHSVEPTKKRVDALYGFISHYLS